MGQGSLTLDSSSHHTGDAAFTPATPQDMQHPRANTDSHNSHNRQHARAKQNELSFTQRALSPAIHVLEDTSHQTRPQNQCE
jgi:hypothetical protein